jgi:hypothetical protein
MLECVHRAGPLALATGAAAMLFLLFPQLAVAEIDSITITPPRPTEQDPIEVTVDGGFPDQCWSVVSTSCDSLRGHDIYLSVRAVDSSPLGCYMVGVAYRLVCAYDPLQAGTYTIHVCEYHDSIREPDARTLERSIEVATAVAITRVSWGCVRDWYR